MRLHGGDEMHHGFCFVSSLFSTPPVSFSSFGSKAAQSSRGGQTRQAASSEPCWLQSFSAVRGLGAGLTPCKSGQAKPSIAF